MTRATGWMMAVAVTALTAIAACGGGGGTPTTPGGGSGAPGASGATITIANNRVNPATVTISVGQSVTFVNNNGRGHNVSSDPHPTHTECPAINAVNNLTNGQTRLTNAFTSARTCGFHHHDDPDNPAYKGTIVIQ